MKQIFLFGILFFSVLMIPIADAQQFEKATLQESATVIFDQKLSKSVIVSVGLETTDNDEIRFPDGVMKKINSNEKIRSVIFTNIGECVIGVTIEQQCIMINFCYEELKGDGGIRMVQDSAREMGDLIIDDLNEVFRTDAKFHSTFIHTVDDANTLMKTSGIVSGRGSVSATYVTDKSATDFLFSDLAGVLIPSNIREGGGFYDVMTSIAKDDNAVMSISLIPNDDSNLLIFKVTKEIKDESGDVSSINVLEKFGVDKISRTNYFDGKNVPLNSVIHLIVIPDEVRKINAIATHAITDVTSIENIMKKGWFLSSPAGEIIDLRFLFGESKTISAEELRVETTLWDMESEIALYSVEDIPEEQIVEENDVNSNEEDAIQYAVLGIIIAIGIGAAVFYLKGYKPKH